MPLLSLNLGGGFSVDSVCHLRNRPGLAIQRTFGELFSNAPQFADALRIVLVNRLCEHNSQLISKLLFAHCWLAGRRIILFSSHRPASLATALPAGALARRPSTYYLVTISVLLIVP